MKIEKYFDVVILHFLNGKYLIIPKEKFEKNRRTILRSSYEEIRFLYAEGGN